MTFRLLVGLVVAAATAVAGSAATLAVSGRTFTLDRKPFDMWGIRTASASQSQDLTDHLIAQLDVYRIHGVNTVDVFYMGSSGGYSDPFSPDGGAIDPGHQRRLEQIIRACDQRGLVVVAGIFYQRSDAPRLRDWDAARRAVRTVTSALRPFGNIIINVANEQNHKTYASLPWGRVMEPAQALDLCGIVKEWTVCICISTIPRGASPSLLETVHVMTSVETAPQKTPVSGGISSLSANVDRSPSGEAISASITTSPAAGTSTSDPGARPFTVKESSGPAVMKTSLRFTICRQVVKSRALPMRT